MGSAYGGTGIWSRWACYVATGHGYNDEFTCEDCGDRTCQYCVTVEHALRFARFSLIVSIRNNEGLSLPTKWSFSTSQSLNVSRGCRRQPGQIVAAFEHGHQPASGMLIGDFEHHAG